MKTIYKGKTLEQLEQLHHKASSGARVAHERALALIAQNAEAMKYYDLIRAHELSEQIEAANQETSKLLKLAEEISETFLELMRESTHDQIVAYYARYYGKSKVSDEHMNHQIWLLITDERTRIRHYARITEESESVTEVREAKEELARSESFLNLMLKIYHDKVNAPEVVKQPAQAVQAVKPVETAKTLTSFSQKVAPKTVATVDEFTAENFTSFKARLEEMGEQYLSAGDSKVMTVKSKAMIEHKDGRLKVQSTAKPVTGTDIVALARLAKEAAAIKGNGNVKMNGFTVNQAQVFLKTLNTEDGIPRPTVTINKGLEQLLRDKAASGDKDMKEAVQILDSMKPRDVEPDSNPSFTI